MFNGVKENPNLDLKTTLLNILRGKMDLTRISDADISIVLIYLWIFCSPDNIAPVLSTFRDKEIAESIYAAKNKVAKSGISVSENLTHQRPAILNTGREKYGNKWVWSFQGHVLSAFPMRTLHVDFGQLRTCFNIY